MKISQIVYKLWGVHKFFGEIWKMNKNGITWKLEKGEKSFLHMTHCIYLRHISKNFMKISKVVIELWDVQE